MCEVSSVCQKEKELWCGHWSKFEVQIWPWPFDPKIFRGPTWVMVNKCVKYRLYVKRKRSYGVDTDQSLKSKFDFDLSTSKSIEVLLWSWSTHVWSIFIVRQKEKVIVLKQ